MPPARVIMSSRRSPAGWAGIRPDGRIFVVHFADDGDERCILSDQRHNGLRLDGSVLDAIDDLLLHLRRRLAGGGYKTRVRHGNKSLGVNRLVRERHVIARPNACLSRNEQAAGCCLENRDAEHVANPEMDLRRRTTIAKHGRKGPRSVLVQNIDDFGVQPDQAVGRSIPRDA